MTGIDCLDQNDISELFLGLRFKKSAFCVPNSISSASDAADQGHLRRVSIEFDRHYQFCVSLNRVGLE